VSITYDSHSLSVFLMSCGVFCKNIYATFGLSVRKLQSPMLPQGCRSDGILFLSLLADKGVIHGPASGKLSNSARAASLPVGVGRVW
jgi:hypothetical protein